MSEHTQEPWDATTHPHHAPGMRPDLEEQYTLSETDFRRASACVNALAGKNPDSVGNAIVTLEGIVRNTPDHQTYDVATLRHKLEMAHKMAKAAMIALETTP